MRGAPSRQMPEVGNLEDFWDIVERHERKLLALDYDGTLAPFRVGLMEALPLEGIVPLLEKISRRRDTALAVISGRPLADLARLLLPWTGLMVGSHGFEERTADGKEVFRQPGEVFRAGLERAAREARGRGKGRLEVKPSSVALHTRGLSEREARRAEEEVGALWREISRGSGLKLTRFNRGLELCAPGWDKGKALEGILAREPAGTFCVYIGDDLTDEDAFRVVRGPGLGIKVGGARVPTNAAGSLPDVPAVRSFLQAWACLGRTGRSGGKA